MTFTAADKWDQVKAHEAERYLERIA
jgi:hypothetical protein